jgi:hypothetical protein
LFNLLVVIGNWILDAPIVRLPVNFHARLDIDPKI